MKNEKKKFVNYLKIILFHVLYRNISLSFPFSESLEIQTYIIILQKKKNNSIIMVDPSAS